VSYRKLVQSEINQGAKDFLRMLKEGDKKAPWRIATLDEKDITLDGHPGFEGIWTTADSGRTKLLRNTDRTYIIDGRLYIVLSVTETPPYKQKDRTVADQFLDTFKLVK
jgi:hypothetical protein